MKKYVCALLCFSMGYFGLVAQKTAKEAMLKKQEALDTLDIVEKFDGSFIPDKAQLKKRAKANEAKRKELLELIAVSDLKKNQKEKLSHDVLNNPFSNRLKKFVSELKVKKPVKETEALAVLEEN